MAESATVFEGKEDDEKRFVSGAITSTLQFTDMGTHTQRSLQISAHIYTDDKLPDINRRADIAQAAIERQYLIHDLRRLEDELARAIEAKRLTEQYAKELSSRENDRKAGRMVKHLVAQEKKFLEDSPIKIENARKQIEDLETRIAARKQECGLG